MTPEFAALLAQVIPVVVLAVGFEIRDVVKDPLPPRDPTPVVILAGAAFLPALGFAEGPVLIRAGAPSWPIVIVCVVLGFVLSVVLYVPIFMGACKVAETFDWRIFSGDWRYWRFGGLFVLISVLAFVVMLVWAVNVG